jgi:ribosomal protein S18 acetylase RimI-like enzyme
MKIEELSRQEYQNYPLESRYKTKFYYHIKVKNKKNISMSIDKKKYLFAQEKKFKSILFASHLIVSDVFGMLEKKNLMAVIEGSMDTINNRYVIPNLWVDAKVRRKKYATELLGHIEVVAKKKGARAIFIEVSSTNYPAICFLRKNGYEFNGFDGSFYSNKDILKKEVKIDFVKHL